jgi:hypothetical protein
LRLTLSARPQLECWKNDRLMNWPFKIIRNLGKGVGLLFPDCRNASRLQSAELDRQLPKAQKFGLKLHLLLCKWCRRYGKQIRFLHTSSHQFGDPECSHPPQSLTNEARQRILEKLKSPEK